MTQTVTQPADDRPIPQNPGENATPLQEAEALPASTDQADPDRSEPVADPGLLPGPDVMTSADPVADHDPRNVSAPWSAAARDIQPDPLLSEIDALAPTEAATAWPQPVPVVPQRGRGGAVFLGLLLGAGIAAGVGFAMQRYVLIPPAIDTSALEARLAAAEVATEGLQAEIARLAAAERETEGLRAEVARLAETDRTPLPADPALIDRIAALEAAGPGPAEMPAEMPADLAARLDAIEADLAAGATLPSDTGVTPAALTALQAEVAALTAANVSAPGDLESLAAAVEARLTEAEAAAAALAATTETLARAAETRAALGQIRAALDSGLPYGSALAAFAGAEVPDALMLAAETGLPTLPALQAAFPAAARLALEQALRANLGESWTERVAAYLRTQTGARSLTPREGSDPDAVLSRAEAALAQGDLPAAMAELAALSPEASAALAPWITLAQSRLDAQAALADLALRLGQ